MSNSTKELIEKLKKDISDEQRKEYYLKIDDFFCKEKMSLESIIFATTDFINNVIYSQFMSVINPGHDEKKIEKYYKEFDILVNGVIDGIQNSIEKIDGGVSNMQIIDSLFYAIKCIVNDHLIEVIKKSEEEQK